MQPALERKPPGTDVPCGGVDAIWTARYRLGLD
jgi:hypothetical protein